MHIALALPDRAESGNGGGADYVRGLRAALAELGHHVAHLDRADTLPTDACIIVDGMALPQIRERWADLQQRDCTVLVHHVAAAAGRDRTMRDQVQALEAELLPTARRIVATSQPVATRLLAEYGVTASVVTPGAHDLPRALLDRDPPVLFSVGVFTRRKGHDRVLRALAGVADLPWQAAFAGDAGREPAYVDELAALIDQLALADRCQLLPDPHPARLEQTWRTASVFASASRWEGYPLAAAEALRRGIPVITTEASNAADLIPPDAGLIVATDDQATFGKCLRRMLFDTDLRRDLAEHAWAAGQNLPTWRQQAQSFLAILDQ